MYIFFFIKPYEYVNTRWVNAEFLVGSGMYLLAVLVEVKREKGIFFFQSFIGIRTELYLPFDLSTF